MKNLLTLNGSLKRGQKIDLDLQRLVEKHASNIKKQMAYYKANYMRVPGDHPLISLMYNIDVTTPLETFAKAKMLSHELASPLGFTTSIHRGNVIYDAFYGDDTPCGILVNNELTTSDLLRSRDWTALTPLKVLKVPSVENSLVRPDLAIHSEGIAVVSIDIPAFAYMFASWLEYQMTLSIDKREGYQEFLGKYVFPNMMPSQGDCFLIEALKEKTPAIAKNNNIAILLPDTAYKLVKEVKEFTGKIHSNSTIEQVLENLPAITAESQINRMPELTDLDTQSNYWLPLTVYAGVIDNISDYIPDNPEQTSIRTQLFRENKRIRSEGTVRKINDDFYSAVLQTTLISINNKFT